MKNNTNICIITKRSTYVYVMIKSSVTYIPNEDQPDPTIKYIDMFRNDNIKSDA